MIGRIKSYLNKGNARSARARKNIAAMVLLRGTSALCSLIVVPLTIGYVDKYEYGIWLTISSLVAWLSFFDLGIGNGLRNKFIDAVARHKPKLARIYVSTAYSLIGMLVGAVWLIAVTASYFIDWCDVLNARADLAFQLRWTVIIVITNFSLIFILALNRTLLIALQKPAISSVFDTTTQVLLCAVLWILTHYTDGTLIHLAFAMGGTSMAVLIASNIWTFSTVLRPYRPSFRYVRFRMARGIMSMGILFFFLQIIAIAFYQTNNLIISQFVGPAEVTVYNIAYKYTNVLPMIFSILITPFWSAYAEANVNGDYDWMRSTTSKLIRTVGMLAMLGVVMVVFSPVFYKIWIRDVVDVPLIITALVCAFQILNIWSTLWTQLLCGFGKIRLQTICSSLCCLSYLPLGIMGCKYFGLKGLLIASLISLVAFTSWFGIIQVHKLTNRTAKGIWNK